jgi:MoaA/NifB/PqqE/SkfB family radical SAM enzyme
MNLCDDHGPGDFLVTIIFAIIGGSVDSMLLCLHHRPLEKSMRHSLLQNLFPSLRRKSFLAWQIEITTRCPLSCSMCIRQGLPEWQHADMGLSDFSKLVPYFSDVESLILQGWGEPLLHRDLIPLIRTAKGGLRINGDPPGKSSAPAVGFVTSGKGLDARYSSELIDAGLDFIGFSFAGSSAATHEAIRVNSDFSELVTTVHDFNELKHKKRRSGLRSHMVYLMLRDNLHEILNLPRLARDIGIHEIFLINLIHVTTSWQDSQKVFSCEEHADTPDILREAEERARELGVHLRRPSLRPRETPVCEENPLRTLYISVSGDVSPCVYLYPPTASRLKRIFCGQEHEIERVSFGNILQAPFSGIWEGEDYREYRGQIGRRVQSARTRLFPFIFFADRTERSTDSLMPEPPAPCRTCHKMLGV